jgi:cobalt/nickel transport system permease protein
LLVDRWSSGSSLIHRLDPRAKLVALLALLVALATANRGVPLLALELLLLLGLGFVAAQIPIMQALTRAAIVLPFAATFAVISWLGGEPGRGLSLLLKSYISALAVLLLVSTTRLPALLGALEDFGAPRFLLEVAQFLYRYLFLLSGQVAIMAQAAAARGASGGTRFRASGGALGTLFAQSYVRAENIHRAMLARGFAGRLPGLAANRFRPADALFLAFASAAPWALRYLAQMAPARP